VSIQRWKPKVALSRQERFILKRCQKKRRLFSFLREYRHRLFDEAFQDELEEMYRDTGAGKEPVSPAVMAMALILQGYLGVSDADAVELTVVDLRWQMVLGRLGRLRGGKVRARRLSAKGVMCWHAVLQREEYLWCW